MKITIVQFYAFNQLHEKVFTDKTLLQVHTELKKICNTYVVSSIMQASGAQFQPICVLTDLQKADELQ